MVLIKSEILNDVDSIYLLSRRQSQFPITADYEALLQIQWKRAGEGRPLSTCTRVFWKMVSSLSKTFLTALTGAFGKLLSGWRSFITSDFFLSFFCWFKFSHSAKKIWSLSHLSPQASHAQCGEIDIHTQAPLVVYVWSIFPKSHSRQEKGNVDLTNPSTFLCSNAKYIIYTPLNETRLTFKATACNFYELPTTCNV